MTPSRDGPIISVFGRPVAGAGQGRSSVPHLILYDTKSGFRKSASPRQMGRYLADPSLLLWLDIADPTPEEHALLTQAFGFHPLAVEDTEHAHQRPKIESYGKYYFAVLYAIRAPEAQASTATAEVALFIGANYLVTVHHGAVPVLGEVAARWQSGDPGAIPNVTALLYELLDAMVDDYFPVVDALGERIDDVEDRIFTSEGTEALQPIFQLKRDLLALRRILAPARDVVNVLMRRELPFLDAGYFVYFQDVYDHLARLTESVDMLRDILSGTLEAHLSVVSNRLNQVMKVLTALSATLMSSALIAGIYGMNFRTMPELRWQYGYPFALLLMVLVTGGLAFFFRRRGWL